MNKNLTLITVGLAVLFNVTLQAEPLKITITSNSKDESVETVLPTSVEIIEQDDIAAIAPTSIGDLLTTLSSIQIINTGAGEAIALRGFSAGNTANNVLVLVNGRRLNNNDISTPDLSTISLPLIERVEIIRGSAAVLYGDNAVAGVINIITKDHNLSAKSQLEGNFLIGYGSYNAQTLNADLARQFDSGFSISTNIHDQSSDGYRDYNSSKQQNARIRTEYIYQENNLYVELEHHDEKRDLPSGLSADELATSRTQVLDNFLTDFQDVETEVLRLGVEQKLSDSWVYKIDAFNRQAEELSQASGRSFAAFQAMTNRNHKGVSPRFIGKLPIANGNLQILTGLDYDISEIKFDWGRENKQTVSSFFINVDYPLSDQLVLTAGSRASQVDDNLIDPSLYANGVKFENDVAANEIGLAYQQSNGLRIYTRVAESFRLPKVDEQAYTSPGVLGLEPQKGLSQEVGVELRQESMTFAVSAYVLNLEDEIIYDATAPTPVGGFFAGANVNADESTRRGYSINYEYNWPTITVGTSVDFTEATFDTGANVGNTVPFVAEEKLNAFFSHAIASRLNYRINASYVGEMFAVNDEANALDKLPAYLVVDASIIFNPGRWTHTFKLNNIFNKEYSSYVANDFFDGLIYTPAEGQNFQFNSSYNF